MKKLDLYLWGATAMALVITACLVYAALHGWAFVRVGG